MAFTGNTAQEFVTAIKDVIVDPVTGLQKPSGMLIIDAIKEAFPTELHELAYEFVLTGTDMQALLFFKERNPDEWTDDAQAQLDAIFTPNTLYNVIKKAVDNKTDRGQDDYSSRRRKIGNAISDVEDYLNTVESGQEPSLLSNIYYPTGFEENPADFSDEQVQRYEGVYLPSQWTGLSSRNIQQILDNGVENYGSIPTIHYDFDGDGKLTQSDVDNAARWEARYKEITGERYDPKITGFSTSDPETTEAEVPDNEGFGTAVNLLDFDANGVVDALSDGVLYLRYLFGLRGEQLFPGAVAEDATRSTEEILAYLEDEDSPIRAFLDLDGNGVSDALTDGVLLLRHAFGLTGSMLTSGASAKNSPLTEPEVEAKIKEMITLLPKKDIDGNYFVVDKEGTRKIIGASGKIVDAPDSDSDPVFWDGASSQAIMEAAGNPEINLHTRAAYKRYAESLGLSLEEFMAQYDYTGDGEVNIGDVLNVQKYELGTQTQEPGWDFDNYKEFRLDRDEDGVDDDNDYFPDDPLYQREQQYFEVLDENRTKSDAIYAAIDFLNNKDKSNQTLYIQGLQSLSTEEKALVEQIRKLPQYVQGLYRRRNKVITDADRELFFNLVQTTPDNDVFSEYKLTPPAITDYDPDSDGDGVVDSEDAFPNNPRETADSDGDGFGDNNDAFPNDPNETLDSDGDSYGDNADAFPTDPNEWVDTDKDGVGNNTDEFPQDPNESVDTDNDGVGNNADYDINNPDIKSEEDYLDTIDTDEDGTPDYKDFLPSDPKYQTKEQQDKQFDMNRFADDNSRAFIGVYNIERYKEHMGDSLGTYDFSDPKLQKFLKWKNAYVKNWRKLSRDKGNYPRFGVDTAAAKALREWLMDNTESYSTRQGKNKTIYHYDEEAKFFKAFLAAEGDFFMEGRVSEREAMQDAVMEWQLDGAPDEYMQILNTQGLVIPESLGGVADVVERHATARKVREEQLNMLFDAMENAWETAGSFFSPDSGMGGSMRHMELAWGPVYQEGGDLAIGERVTGPDDPRGEGRVIELDGPFEYAPEKLEPFNDLLPNPATRRDWQNMGLGKFINDFVDKYGEEEFVKFATEYKDLINDPLNLNSGENAVTHSSGASGIEHTWANGTGGPILKFLEEDYKDEEINKWKEVPRITEDEEIIIDRYTEATEEVLLSIESGTTAFDREIAVNLGGALRLGDAWAGRKESQKYKELLAEGGEEYAEEEYTKLWLASIPDYEVDAYIELPNAFQPETIQTNMGWDTNRLYMKMPGDDDITFGKYGDWVTPMYLNDATVRNSFANVSEDSAFPHGAGNGAGYFVDIGTESQVGDYTMIWVQLNDSPSTLEKILDDLGPLKAIVQIGLTIFGGPAGAKLALDIELATIALKVLDGQTLHGEDWASLAISGLVKLGKITMPVPEEVAKAEAAARGLAEGSKAYVDYMNVAQSGIGIAGMNYSQTITVLRAAGAGNLEDAILPVLVDFGDDWIKGGLSALGASDEFISNMTKEQFAAINGVVEKMARGDDFDEAILGETIDFLGDYLGDLYTGSETQNKLRTFFEGMENDIKNMMRVAQEFMGDSDLANLGDYLLGQVEQIPFGDILATINEDFEATMAKLQKVLDESELVQGIDKYVIDNIDKAIDSFVVPVIAKGKLMYEDLPDGVKNQIEKLDEDLEKYVGAANSQLDPAIKEAVKVGLVQELLGQGGTLQSKAQIVSAFTRELITVEQLKKMDATTVDILTAPVAAAGIRAALNTVLQGNPNAGDNALRAMAATAENAIRTSVEGGTFPSDFKNYMDNVSGNFDIVVAKRSELDDIQKEGDQLSIDMENAEKVLADLKKQRTDLLAAANAPDATEDDQRALAELQQDPNYNAALAEATNEIVKISTEIKNLDAKENALADEYETLRDDLGLQSQFDPAVKKFNGDVMQIIMEANAPEVINNPEGYRQLNGLGPDVDVIQHYLSEGIFNGAPTTAEEYNGRVDAGVDTIYTAVITESGIDDSKLTSGERLSIRNQIKHTIVTNRNLDDAGTLTDLQYVERIAGDDLTIDVNASTGEISIVSSTLVLSDLDGAVLAGINNAYVTEDGQPAGFTNLEQVENRIKAREYVANETDLLSYTGIPLQFDTPEEQEQFFQTLIKDGQVRVINDAGEYTWTTPPSSIQLDVDTQSVNSVPQTQAATTLNDLVNTDPDAYLSILGGMDNQSAMDAVNSYLESAGMPPLTPTNILGVPIEGIPKDEDMPWIVRTAKRYLDWKQQDVTELQDKIKEIEDIPEDERSWWQNNRLGVYKNQLEYGIDAVDDAAKFVSTSAAFFGYGNTAFRSLAVSDEVIAAQMEGEKAYRDKLVELAIENDIVDSDVNFYTDVQLFASAPWAQSFVYMMENEHPDLYEEARLAGVKHTETLYKDIGLESITNNEFSNTVDMLIDVSEGYLSSTYTDERDAMYARMNEAEGQGAWANVKAVFGAAVEFPTMFYKEVVREELAEIGWEVLIARGAGRVVKEFSPDIAKDITLKIGITGDASVEFGSTWSEAESTIRNTLENANIQSQNAGGPILYTEDEIDYHSVKGAYDAATTTVAIMAGTNKFTFKLDRQILGESASEVIELTGDKMLRVGNLVGTSLAEGAGEFFTEGGGALVTSSYLYGLGFTDIDPLGEAARSGTLGFIAGTTTSATVMGLSTPLNDVFGGDSNDPIANTLVTQYEPLKVAIENKDVLTTNALLTDIGVSSMDFPQVYNAVMNTVDDENYVTVLEAERAYEYIGFEPSGSDIEVALTMQDQFSAPGLTVNLSDRLTDYVVDSYGEDKLGTGRTTAQNYDIIKHLEDMRDGIVPLDATFIDAQTGESTLTQDVIDAYVAGLPLREQSLLAQYNEDNHVPTNIVEELGGSLMTQAEIDKINTAIADLQARPDSPTAQEVLEILLADTSISGIPNQVKNLVDAAFQDATAQANFAAAVVQKLVDDGSLETLATGEVSEALGSSVEGDESGIYLLLKNLSADIASGDSDAATNLANAVEALNTALTNQGVADANARAAITDLLGSNEAGKESGIFKVLKELDAGQTTTDQAVASVEAAYKAANTAQDTTIASLATNLGSPATDEKKASGVYLVIETAIAAESSAREEILGDYTDIAAFETALNSTMDEKVSALKTTIGVPGEYKINADGTIKYKANGDPDWKTAPTGHFLDVYNASKLEGIEREAALLAVQTKLDADIASARGLATSEATRVKDEIINTYFPAAPSINPEDNAIIQRINYMQSILADGPVPNRNDPRYDPVADFNENGYIGVGDVDNLYKSLGAEQRTRVRDYMVFLDGDTLLGQLRKTQLDADMQFNTFDNKLTLAVDSINNTITNDVLNQIGKSAEDNDGTATGLYARIEAGDSDILTTLGAIGEDGSGILRDLELAGLSINQIQQFLDDNIGKPAENNNGTATGLFAAAKQNADAITGLTSDIATINRTLSRTASQSALNSTNQRLSTAETDIDNLQSDLKTEQGKVTTAQGDISTLQTDLTAATTRLTTAEGNVSTLQSDLQTEQGKVTTAQGDISTLQTDLTAATNTLTTVVDNYASLVESGAATQADLDKAEEAVVQAQTDISNLRIDLTSAESSLTTAQGNISTLQTNLGLEQSKVATAQGDIDDLEDDLTEATTRLTTAETNITTINGNISTLQNDVSGMKTTIAQLENDIASKASTADLTAALTRVSSAENDIGTLETEMDAAEGRLLTAENNITTIEGDLQTEQGKVSTLQTDLTAATGRVSTLETNLQTEQGKVSTLQTDLQTEQGKVSTLQTDLSSATGRVSTLETDLTAATTRLSTAEGKLTTLQNTSATKEQLDAAKADIKTEQDNVDKLQTDLQTEQGKVSTLQTDLTAATGRVSTLETNLQTEQGKVSTLQTDLQTEQGKVSQLQIDLSNANSKVTKLQTDLNNAVARVTTAEDDIDTLETEMDAAEGRLDTAETTLDTVQTSLGQKASVESLNNATTRLTTAEGKVSTLEQEMDAAEGRLADAETKLDSAATSKQIDDANTLIDAAEKDIKELTTALDTEKGKVTKAQTDINAIQTSLTKKAAQTDLDSAKDRITDAEAEVDTLQTDLQTEQGKVSQLQTDLTAATGRLTTAETALKTLQESGAATQTDLDTAEADIKIEQDNVDKLQTDLSSATGRVSTLETDLTAATTRLSTAEENITSLQGALGRLSSAELSLAQAQLDLGNAATKEELETAKQRLSTAETSISTITGDITNLQTLVGTKASTEDLEAAKLRLATAEGKVETLESEMNAAEQRLDKAETDVENLDETLTNTTNALTTATDRVSTLETDLQTEQGKVSTLQTDLTAATTRLSTAEGKLTTLQNTSATKEQLDAAKADIQTEQDNVDKLQTDLGAAQTNITNLQSDLEIEKGKVTTAQGDISTLQTDLTAATGRLTTAEDNVTNLRLDLSTAETNLSEAQNDIAKIQTSLSGTQDDLDKAVTRVTDAELEIDTLQSDLETEQNNVDKAQTDITNLRTDLTAAETRLTTAESELTALQGSGAATQADLDKAETAVKQAQTDVDTIKGRLTSAEGRLNTAEDNITSLTGRITSAESDLTTAKDDLTNLQTEVGKKAAQTDLDNAKSRIANAETNITNLQTDLQTEQGNVDTLQTDLEAAETRLTTAEAALVTLQGSGAATQADLDKAEADIQTEQGKVSTLQTDLTAATGRVSTLETNLETATNNLAQAQEQLLEITTSLGTKAEQADLVLAQGRLTDAETKVGQLQTDLTAATTRLTTAENNYASLLETGTATQGDLDTAEIAIEIAKGDISDLETALETEQGKVTAAQQDITTLQADVATKAAQTDLEAAETRLTTAEATLLSLQESGTATQADLDKAEEAVAQAQTDVTNLRTDLGTAQTDITTLQADVATKAAQTDLEAAETRLTTAENNYASLLESGTATQADLDKAEEAVAQAQTDVTNLRTDLGTAQQDITTLQADVATKAAQTDLEAAETRLTTAENNYASLLESGTATQADLDKAEEAVAQAQTDVTNLRTDLGTAQQDITTLQADVATKAAQDTVDTLQTDLTAATDRLATAENNYSSLLESGTATQADLDTAEDAITTAQTDIKNIQGQLQDLATRGDIESVSGEIQVLANLIGKPANELTQEEVNLAESYLEAATDEYNALYDVNNDGTFDSEDIRFMQDVVDTGDYSTIADSQFTPATGLFAEQEQAELEFEQQLEQQRQQNLEAQLNMQTEFQNMLTAQTEERQREELVRAMQQERKVTEQQAPLTNIDYIYDFAGDNVFATDQQKGFYESASMYGDNFLNDIILPQQRRAKGGMIKDKTDEILKIIGDK